MTRQQCLELVAEGHRHLHCEPYDWGATIAVLCFFIPLAILVVLWFAYGKD